SSRPRSRNSFPTRRCAGGSARRTGRGRSTSTASRRWSPATERCGTKWPDAGTGRRAALRGSANLRGFANRAETGCDLRRRCVVPMRRSENFGTARPAHSETPSMHVPTNRFVTLGRGVLALALVAFVALLAPAARAQGLRAHATLWARADG